jgi:hypothetical protein
MGQFSFKEYNEAKEQKQPPMWEDLSPYMLSDAHMKVAKYLHLLKSEQNFSVVK